MKLVRSRLDDHVSHAAAGTSKLSRQRADFQLELANRIHRRNPLRNVDSAIHVDGIGHAVHKYIGSGNRCSVGGKQNVCDGVVRARVLAIAVVHHARSQREHEQRTAALERKVVPDLTADRGAKRGAVGFYGGRAGFYANGLGCGAQRQRDIFAQYLAQIQCDLVANRGTEPCCFH